MECKKVHKLIEGYIDNKLSGGVNTDVRMHLSSCEKCQSLYKNVLKTIDILKPSAEITEQPFYYTRLKQRIDNKTEVKPSIIVQVFSKKILQPVAYLASVILAVYIGILIGSNSPGNNQYSNVKDDSSTPLESFAEYSYFNDLELEAIESFIIKEDEYEKKISNQ